MNDNLIFSVSSFNLLYTEFYKFINSINEDFIPPFTQRVNIEAYYNKLKQYSTAILCKHENRIVGMLLMYDNNIVDRYAYITFTAVLAEYRGKGIATKLLKQSFINAKEHNMNSIGIDTSNADAMRLYKDVGFKEVDVVFMEQHKIKRYHLVKEL